MTLTLTFVWGWPIEGSQSAQQVTLRKVSHVCWQYISAIWPKRASPVGSLGGLRLVCLPAGLLCFRCWFCLPWLRPVPRACLLAGISPSLSPSALESTLSSPSLSLQSVFNSPKLVARRSNGSFPYLQPYTRTLHLHPYTPTLHLHPYGGPKMEQVSSLEILQPTIFGVPDAEQLFAADSRPLPQHLVHQKVQCA